MTTALGRRRWVIAEGYLPRDEHQKSRELESHEAACLLNCSDTDARVQLTVYFRDREPVGPYVLVVPARRSLHMRFNDLREPAPIPKGTDYSTVIESNVPIVVQHTRLDSRTGIALFSTVAFPSD
jgi:hypothetical protein